MLYNRIATTLTLQSIEGIEATTTSNTYFILFYLLGILLNITLHVHEYYPFVLSYRN